MSTKHQQATFRALRENIVETLNQVLDHGCEDFAEGIGYTLGRDGATANVKGLTAKKLASDPKVQRALLKLCREAIGIASFVADPPIE